MVVAGLLNADSRQAARGGMILIFMILLVSGVSKLIRPDAFVQQISGMTFIPMTLMKYAWLIGILETALAIVLGIRRFRWKALFGVMLLFTGFSALAIVLLVNSYSGSCGCFPWQDRLGWWTVVRDTALLAATLTIMIKYRSLALPSIPQVAAIGNS